MSFPGGARRNLYRLETLQRLVNEAEDRATAGGDEFAEARS